MSFRSKLMLVAIRGKNKYQLVMPLSFHHAPDRKYYVVPKGFITDFASIPFFMKWLIDDNGKHIREAAVLHDWLYSDLCNVHGMTREKADSLFWWAMDSLGAPNWKKDMVYASVRAFGWLFYKGGGGEQ